MKITNIYIYIQIYIYITKNNNTNKAKNNRDAALKPFKINSLNQIKC